MIRKKYLYFILMLLLVLSCNLPTLGEEQSESAPPSANDSEPTMPAVEEIEQDALPPSSTQPLSSPGGESIMPEDLVYRGAFRLPDASGGSSWEYSGHALTYYPGGDSNGTDDGYPGSLFGAGHDQQLYVSEISIPEPVISKNLDDLNTATTLQDFHDITGGRITEDLALPRLGLEYLPAMGEQTSAKLHFVIGQHIQAFEPSHGWSELDLSNPDPQGLWVFDGYTNYATSDYIIEIPEAWAAVNTPGMRLATGRYREGVWSGRGPALFAYAPWNDGNPPKSNATLSTITPLLLYGIQLPEETDIVSDETMWMAGHNESDHWWGSAWLTAGDKSAVLFVGTKAVGKSWYGFPNGIVWEYDCADVTPPTCPEYPEYPYDQRGFWAEDFKAQIIFFNPDDLAKVARGEMETYEPQPYAAWDVNQYLFDPKTDLVSYKRDILGASAFDRAHGYLYVFERLADDEKSVIHVWQVQPD